MGNMMWYSWTSKEAFDQWHSEAKALLNMPLPGYNAETGEQVNQGMTTEYTEAIVVTETDVRAWVQSNIAPTKLGVPSEAPPQDIDFTP
jgi:hypothetical protein